VVDVAPRTPSRRGARLDQRVRDATNNVTTALAGAVDRGPLAHHLEQAADEWSRESTRIERDLRVAERLTGDAHKQALRALAARVDELCLVADRIVGTAFLAPLTPTDPELDGLRRARERIDALDQAYDELDALDRPAAAWRAPATVLRVRARLPHARRRSAS
jgi:hypothetical protein